MKRNSLDTHLLSIAQGMIESGFNIYIHHQPKHNNRRWGIRRHDFSTQSTAWVSPKSNSNEFNIKLTGDFRRFDLQLSKLALRQRSEQNLTVYYFEINSAEEIFATLAPHKKPSFENNSHIDAINQNLESAINHALLDTPENRAKRLSQASEFPEKVQATITVFKRNPDVVAEVILRAKGTCERCKSPAPFTRKSNQTPYLEVHHIIRLADGGKDTIENTLALCPNCHRELHFGAGTD